MARYFEEHRVREVQSLNGVWKFMTDPQDEGEQNGWQNQLPTKETVTVPSFRIRRCSMVSERRLYKGRRSPFLLRWCDDGGRRVAGRCPFGIPLWWFLSV